MPYAIETHAVGKAYGTTVALHEVDLRLAPGQVVGLLGHNGAGKSTLIKLLLGLIRPTHGRVSVLGVDPAGGAARTMRQRIGYLPENVSFYGHLSGRETLAYLAALKHAPRRDNGALLARVGLAEHADRRERTYSKGLRQRLGLAQALLGDPQLLLLDEPTSGLDPIATRDFFALVRELRTQGRTVVISSHVLPELEPHIDRALILGHGRLLAEGSVAELRAAMHLPITVAARFEHGATEALDDWLRRCAAVIVRREPDAVEFQVPRASKLDAVRHLSGLHNITDIEVREATLAHLYAAIGADHHHADAHMPEECCA